MLKKAVKQYQISIYRKIQYCASSLSANAKNIISSLYIKTGATAILSHFKASDGFNSNSLFRIHSIQVILKSIFFPIHLMLNNFPFKLYRFDYCFLFTCPTIILFVASSSEISILPRDFSI